MRLSEIYEGQKDIEISGIAIDSRKVRPGYMFFCLKGLETDGHRFVDKAIEAGAGCIVHSDDIPRSEHSGSAESPVFIKVEDTLTESNRVCDLFYGRPSSRMTVFGVTGTNGKSTTASIISSIYSAKEPCGYMGTIAVRYGDYSRVPTLTTPDQVEVHATLAEMRDHGMKAVAMEVSSHGLSMSRTDSVDFDCAIFTNISYDHLDYHKTMENYLDAKKKLFSGMGESGVAVLNADDEDSFDVLKGACSCRVVSYGTDQGRSSVTPDYFAKDIRLTEKGTDFVLCAGNKEYEVHTNLVALYNIYNLLGAMAAMDQMGMSMDEMIPLVADIPQVDGRMEVIDEGQEFMVVVDYAHTPDGYEKIFRFADEITAGGGSTYAVFGSAGKRDKVKRKVLGSIAGRHCRRIFVTEEDPRNEKAEDIADQIMEGIAESGGNCIFIPDRTDAIAQAVRAPKKGDLLLVLGKGDETYMYYENGRVPYAGDNAVVRGALRDIKGKEE